MQNKHNFNAVNRKFRDIMDIDALSGGIPVVLGGDFTQFLPVMRRGQKENIVNAFKGTGKFGIILRLFLNSD